MSKPDTSRVDVASWQEAIEALAPCPFCGSDAVVLHPNDIAPDGAAMATSGTVEYAHCDGCGAEGPQSMDGGLHARNAWNRRALTPPERAASPSGESGWRRVPVEPTPQMRAAGSDALAGLGKFGPAPARTVYAAMLAAAPPAPDVPAQAESGEVERLKVELEEAHDALREIACTLSVGGYNAEKVDPQVFLAKFHDGIDILTKPLVKDAERYRKLRSIGAAPAGTISLENGTVFVSTNLDAWVDAKIKNGLGVAPSHAAEGELSPQSPLALAEARIRDLAAVIARWQERAAEQAATIRDLEAEAAASRAEVERLTAERDGARRRAHENDREACRLGILAKTRATQADVLAGALDRVTDHLNIWAGDHSEEATPETWAAIYCARAALAAHRAGSATTQTGTDKTGGRDA